MGQSQSKAAKRPARALSPMRGVNRKGVDHPIPPPRNRNTMKATAVHIPIAEFENAVDEPVNKDPPMSVTQSGTGIQATPIEEIAKAVEDTADEPAKKESSPRIKFEFSVGTLGTEIQSEKLEDLAKAFETMIAKMAKSTGSGVDIDHFIDQINSITVKASEFSAKAQALLAAASKVNETMDTVVAAIEGIASAHPILKISWFIVSAGYKMISDASKVNQEYLELPGQFQAILEYGIADDKERSNLVKASESIILCLTDGAILFTEYMETPSTTWSNIIGPNKNKLDEMKMRLTDVQEAHYKAKAKGSFTVLVTTASNVVDIKSVGQDTNAVVHEVARRVENIDATWQAHATKSEVEKLHQLCQNRDPHSGEVTSLVSRCAKGTRKWLVDQILDSIEDGGQQVTWLRCEGGTGKSVVSGLVAQKLEEKNLLGAVFFCKVTTRESLNKLIQTIAFELAMINAPFRTKLVQTLENCKFQDVNENRKTIQIQELLRIFIQEPMKAWPENTPAVVVIDALDEIKDTIENINWLIDAFLQLSPVKLFITSRPEIKESESSGIAFITFDQMAPNNMSDLQLFAHYRLDTLFATFKDFGSRDKDDLTELLVKESNGLFIWMTLVLGSRNQDATQKKEVSSFARKIKQKRTKPSKDELIKSLKETAMLDLQALYCRALSEAFLDGDEPIKEHQLNLYKASVGTLMVLKNPMSRDELPYLVVGEDDPMFDEILDSLDNVSALLRTDEKMKVSFIHKTVPDYLAGIDSLKEYIHCVKDINSKKKIHCVKDINFKVDFAEILFNLTMACLDLLNLDLLKKNMAELDGCMNYSDGTSDKWNVDDVLYASLQYAILYWSDHFIDAFPLADLQKQHQLISKLKLFCGNKLLNYLEAILLADRLEMVAAMVNQVIVCLNVIPLVPPPVLSATANHSLLSSSKSSSDDNPYSDTLLTDVAFICSILKDLQLVSINFRSQLLASPLQVYNNALTLVPQQTAYYHQYQKDLQVRLIMGGEQVKVWDTESGECASTLEGHSDGVTSVAVTPDGKTIVSGSYDTT
ncbi:hypothetical protein CcCBS67573_g09038, partial [Chytriomyces confervae]